MKKIFTLIGLLMALNSYTQSVFRPWVASDANHCNEFEIIVHSAFINHFDTSALKWRRIQNTITSPWTSAFCDCELCHSATVESAVFTLEIGDSCVTSAHFYTNNNLNKSNGIMKIKIFPINDTSLAVIGEYHATCWPAAAKFIEREKLIVTPNPANQLLNIGFGSGEDYLIKIIASDGRVLANEKVQSIANTIDISNYNAGIYSVKIESNGKLFYAKFIKM